MTRLIPIAVAALIAMPANAGPWSLDYDLHGIATESGATGFLDAELAYSFGHGRLFLAPHIPFGRPKPFKVLSRTETVMGGTCGCVTVNTQIEGWVAYQDIPSAQIGVAWDFSDHVTGSLFVEGVRKGPAMVGVELSVHGRIGGE